MSPVTPATTTAAAAHAAAAPRDAKRHWISAVALAVAAAGCGVLLTGVSVWFLGAVALAGLGPAALSFNFHTPAAFVRLFALGKTACKYGERIVGHRAALLDQVRRRTALFTAMAQAPATRAASWQLGNQDRLSDYIEDVEDVDYARLRVGMPALVMLAGSAVLIAATAWLEAPAILAIVVLMLIVAVMLQRTMLGAGRHWAAVRAAQRSAGRRLGAAFAAIVPLKAERSLPPVLAAAFADFTQAAAEQLAQRLAFARLDLAAGLVAPLAGLAVFAAAWRGGYRGDALLIPAFLAFGWLAFGEATGSLSRLVLGRVREAAARHSLTEWDAAPPATSIIPPAPLRRLTLTDVLRQSPDGRNLGPALNLTLIAGRPTVLVGASGAGKTTLLKQIAGWIGSDNDGRFAGDGGVLPSAQRRTLSHLCLHDAAILADTVRDNLFAPAAADADCWAALGAVELDTRIAAAGGLDAWIDQDALSLGEARRLNLARALLCTDPIVLLDEPVEHLDAEQAHRILDRLLNRLADRIVVYSSHGFSGQAAAATDGGETIAL